MDKSVRHDTQSAIWVTSWENLFMPYENNKGQDQPAHLRSLISTFVIRCLDSIIPVVYRQNFKTLPSFCRPVCVLPCQKRPKTGFLVTRLICFQISLMWLSLDKCLWTEVLKDMLTRTRFKLRLVTKTVKGHLEATQISPCMCCQPVTRRQYGLYRPGIMKPSMCWR